MSIELENKSGFRVERVETPPSAIQTDSREALILHTGETIWATGLCLALGVFFVGLSVYGLLTPGFFDQKEGGWFPLVFGGIGALTILAGFGLLSNRQRMHFDFNRQVLHWQHCKKGLAVTTETISFSDFEALVPTFEKAFSSDDSDSWKLSLRLRDGRTLKIFNSSFEEQTYRVLRRLAGISRMTVEDQARLFPLGKEAAGTETWEKPSPEAVSATPPTDYIRSISEGSVPRYELPAARFGMGVLFISLFSFTWSGFVLLGFVTIIRDVLNRQGPVELASIPVLIAFAILFVGVGLLFLTVTLWLLIGRQRIAFTPDGIELVDRMAGRTMQRKVLSPADILRVDALPDESGTWSLKIFLRGSTEVVKFGGSLKEAEARWLQGQILSRMR